MKYGKFLPDHGTIGLIAPSFGCTIEPYHTAFLSAQATWKSMGYRLQLGPNCYKDDGIGISTAPAACAKEFADAYCSEESDVLISCGGGELMCEILPYLPLRKLKKAKPKWFMGYSDNTNLIFLLTTILDTAAIYGPCAPAFGMEPWHEALDDAWEVITGRRRKIHGYDLFEMESMKDEEHPLEPYHVTEPSVPVCIPDSDCRFSGRLVGGCLDILTCLAGTRFDHVREFQKKYRDDGFIWFLEACDLGPIGIRRAVWQLEQAGWFAGARGFLIGRPYRHGETEMGLDQYEAVTGVLRSHNVPILMDLDIGHRAPMMPLISGSFAAVNFKNGRLSMDMELT